MTYYFHRLESTCTLAGSAQTTARFIWEHLPGMGETRWDDRSHLIVHGPNNPKTLGNREKTRTAGLNLDLGP
ncbi:MAG: hypothetical protein OXH01_02790 [Bacteroidetes bacterium]|nr:hypothetical protein [Bacteroidota bacterium]